MNAASFSGLEERAAMEPTNSPAQDSVLSPRIALAVSSSSTPHPSLPEGTLAECLEWLVTKVPEASFVSEATFFLYAYGAMCRPAELLDAVSTRATNKEPRLYEFVALWAKLLGTDEERALLPQLLALPDLPADAANAVKLALLRRKASSA